MGLNAYSLTVEFGVPAQALVTRRPFISGAYEHMGEMLRGRMGTPEVGGLNRGGSVRETELCECVCMTTAVLGEDGAACVYMCVCCMGSAVKINRLGPPQLFRRGAANLGATL